jgi:hypothetical protein
VGVGVWDGFRKEVQATNVRKLKLAAAWRPAQLDLNTEETYRKADNIFKEIQYYTNLLKTI